MNLDRFSQGLPDPADMDVVTHCDECDGEIYENDYVHVYEGQIFCSFSCLHEYIDGEAQTIQVERVIEDVCSH